MKALFQLLAHLLVTIARLLGPGSVQAIVAENLLLKQQLLVMNRTRRAPTPAQISGEVTGKHAALRQYRWQRHCRSLYELPIAP